MNLVDQAEQTDAAETARTLRPGISLSDLKDALGEPDHVEASRGRLVLSFRNATLNDRAHTVAEVDPRSARVLSLAWSHGEAGGWTLTGTGGDAPDEAAAAHDTDF
jgi:hypothetical protein